MGPNIVQAFSFSFEKARWPLDSRKLGNRAQCMSRLCSLFLTACFSHYDIPRHI